MRYDSALQAIVDELGCIAVANVPADVGDIIDGWRKENDKLHDALERKSELIAALRNEIAAKGKRIDDLRIAVEAGLRISETNRKAQQRICELEQTILHLTAQCKEQDSEGKEYSEGCKP